MTDQFRPMLASKMESIEDIRFPVYVSPKIDGIRCLIRDGVPLTRKLKPIPNKVIFKTLTNMLPFDGEIVVGDGTRLHGFDETQSAVMRFDGNPDFTYFVFDGPDVRGPTVAPATFAQRFNWVALRGSTYCVNVKVVPHILVNNEKFLLEMEKKFLAQGYEGLMLRDPLGPYKWGRSTRKEGYLLKMIRKETAEALVIGFVERMHNDNEAETSELGYMKRSKHKANLIPAGTLGALRCCWLDAAKYGDAEFEIGTGFTDAQRKAIWDDRKGTLSKVASFEFREVTKDGAPRFPAFKGFRHVDDMGEIDKELGA